MIKSLLAAGTILVVLAGPALASQCPTLAAKAEEALKTAAVDDATKAKVTELISTGMSQHAAGSHAESEATLGEALKLLGM
jgi:ethanolamine utilization microcompartment shell protein EutL